MVVITGSFHREKWLSALERASKELPPGGSLTGKVMHVGPTQDIREFKTLAREQSHIIVGYKGLTLDDPKRYTLQVMQSILAGQGGRNSCAG